MEKKKSIVRSAIFQKSINSSYGESHIFKVTFDNQDKGQYFSKTNPQSTFQEGKEIEYTIEEKVNGRYTNYLIKPVQLNGFTPGKGNPMYEHKRVALTCACNLAANGTIELKKISEYATSFMKFLGDN